MQPCYTVKGIARLHNMHIGHGQIFQQPDPSSDMGRGGGSPETAFDLHGLDFYQDFLGSACTRQTCPKVGRKVGTAARQFRFTTCCGRQDPKRKPSRAGGKAGLLRITAPIFDASCAPLPQHLDGFKIVTPPMCQFTSNFRPRCFPSKFPCIWGADFRFESERPLGARFGRLSAQRSIQARRKSNEQRHLLSEHCERKFGFSK